MLLGACGPGSDRSNDGTLAAPPTAGTPTTQKPPPDVSAPGTPAAGPMQNPPAFPDDTAPQTGRSSARAELVLTDVRVGEHAGFDRIVLEFSGTGTPGWAVDYVEEAVLDGSGDVVTLGGDAILNISASRTTWPASDYYSGPGRLEAQNGGITDVHVGGTFEGYTQVLAAVDDAPVPFRVFTLAGPSRLVVDVVDRVD